MLLTVVQLKHLIEVHLSLQKSQLKGLKKSQPIRLLDEHNAAIGGGFWDTIANAVGKYRHTGLLLWRARKSLRANG